MKRKGIILLLAAVLALTLTGCQLAKENTVSDAGRTDRLVGVYITRDTAPEEKVAGVIDPDPASDTPLTFPGLTGWALCHLHMAPPDGLAVETRGYYTNISDLLDVHLGVHVTDDTETAYEMSGKLLLLPQEELLIYMNSIYQRQDGTVYLVPENVGHWIGTSPEWGSLTLSTSEAATVTENGKDMRQETSVSVEVAVTARPEEIVVLQMDGGNAVVARGVYAPGHVPEEIAVVDGAAYLLVETRFADGTVERQLVENGTEWFNTIYDRGDGSCDGMSTEVHWPDSDEAL